MWFIKVANKTIDEAITKLELFTVSKR